jgi:hypothetical protein
MSKVDSVILILEFNAKSKCVIIALSFPLHRVLVVAHIFAVPEPPLPKLLGLNFRVHKRLHAMIVETVRFQQIYDVKAVDAARPRILHSEIIPLSVPASAIVRLQNYVIFELVHLDRPSQVSRLKSRLKHKSIVLRGLGHIIGSKVLIIVALLRVHGAVRAHPSCAACRTVVIVRIAIKV